MRLLSPAGHCREFATNPNSNMFWVADQKTNLQAAWSNWDILVVILCPSLSGVKCVFVLFSASYSVRKVHKDDKKQIWLRGQKHLPEN